MNKYEIIASIILAFVAGFFTHKIFHQCENYHSVEYKYIRSVDTVYIPQEPLVIERAVPKVIYRERLDTIVEHRFTAILDTIVRNDTIRLNYYFPEHLLDLYISKEPARTITIHTEFVKKRPMWLDILSHSGAAGLGYIVGGNRK